MANLTPEEKKKLELIKLKRQFQQQIDECFDPDVLDSRAQGIQLEVLQDGEHNLIFVVAPNQVGKCIVKGTLVATPNGPVPIETLKFGDKVYDEHGSIIRVKALFDQGEKEVVDLCHNNIIQATCTEDHIWLVETQRGKCVQKRVKDFVDGDKIIRQELSCPLGNKDIVDAYTLGALLGDGCSRNRHRKSLYISSGTSEIPMGITANAVKLCSKNHTWKLGCFDVSYYEEWCRGRYAHEKIIDLKEVKTWNRKSVLKLLAGLLDTEGYIKYLEKDNNLLVAISMQAKSCIDFIKWAYLALYQHDVEIHIDNRDKYKNGPCYTIRCANSHINKLLLKEIAPYMNVGHKQWKSEWEIASSYRYNPTKIGVRIKNKRKAHCYDIHVDSPTNLYCLANGLVTHNTQTGARHISWFFNNNHPYIERRPEWGEGGINMLVVGRTTSILDHEIWNNKLRKYLHSGTYKEKRGNTLEYVKHLENDNKMIFMSHHDAANAREKVQGFTAPIVWLDEMPDDASLMTELMMRTITRNGIFIATFTPLVENEEVRKLVEAPSKFKKKYVLRPEDNPKIAKDMEAYEERILAMCGGNKNSPEYRARRFGEWYYKSGRVIRAYDPAQHILPAPLHYHPSKWRHVAVVDPSASGMTGLTVWAEDYRTDTWWCVKAEKIQGDAAYNLVQEIEERLLGYHVVKRICDCNPAGFYREALRRGITYEAFTDKMDRRAITIDKLNEAFALNKIALMVGTEDFGDECLTAKWSETNPDKMVHASSYHLIDTARYFVDRMPLPEKKPTVYQSQLHALKQETMKADGEKRLKQEKKNYKIIKRGGKFKRRKGRVI